MSITVKNIELSLLVLGLLIAFAYFVLRAVVWDTFMWILVAPTASGILFAAIPMRYLRIRLNILDRLVILYCIYGLGMAGIGVLFLDSSPFITAKGLVHYYAPMVLYFVARRYTHNSADRILVITKILWILAALFVIDFFVENYVVVELKAGLSIPWVQKEVALLSDVTSQELDKLNVQKVSTVLIGGKRPGFVAAALFVIILPFLLHDIRRHAGIKRLRSWQFNLILTSLVLGGLGYAALKLDNKTALLTAVLVFAIGFVSIRSVRKLLIVTTLVVVVLFFTYRSFADIVENQFINPYEQLSIIEEELTPFAYIFNPENIVETYQGADPYSFFFGGQLLDSSASEARLIGPNTLASSELRGVGLPIFFGVGWALIVGAGLFTIFRYSLRTARTGQFKFFGMAVLGLLLVYLADMHYPSTITHGPIEILAVMVGALSSLYETVKRPAKSVIKSAGPVGQSRFGSRPTPEAVH